MDCHEIFMDSGRAKKESGSRIRSFEKKRADQGSAASKKESGSRIRSRAPLYVLLLLRAGDRVLGGLGHAELHDLLGGNLDRRAGGGVAAHARLAAHENELAQAGNGEAVLRVLVGELGKGFEKAADLNLGEFGGVRDLGDDLALSEALVCHCGSFVMMWRDELPALRLA